MITLIPNSCEWGKYKKRKELIAGVAQFEHLGAPNEFPCLVVTSSHVNIGIVMLHHVFVYQSDAKDLMSTNDL